MWFAATVGAICYRNKCTSAGPRHHCLKIPNRTRESKRWRKSIVQLSRSFHFIFVCRSMQNQYTFSKAREVSAGMKKNIYWARSLLLLLHPIESRNWIFHYFSGECVRAFENVRRFLLSRWMSLELFLLLWSGNGFSLFSLSLFYCHWNFAVFLFNIFQRGEVPPRRSPTRAMTFFRTTTLSILEFYTIEDAQRKTLNE